MRHGLRVSDVTLEGMDLRTDTDWVRRWVLDPFWFRDDPVTWFPVWLLISLAVSCRTSSFLNQTSRSSGTVPDGVM